MAYDLSVIDRYEIKYRRDLTSIYVDIVDKLDNSVKDTTEFSNAGTAGPIPGEIPLFAQGRLNTFITGTSLGGGGIAVPQGIPRAASSRNRIPSKSQVMSAVYASRIAFRYEHVIGSGDRSDLQIIFNGWYGNITGVTNCPNNLTFSNLYLESANLVTSVPIDLNNGAGSLVVAPGDTDIKNGLVISPSVFGLSKFTVGDRYFIRGFVDVPIGGSIIYNNYYDTVLCNASTYDTAVASCTNISGTGVLTYTGSGVSGAPAPALILVGRFVNGDPDTWGGIGDSIYEGYYDTTGRAANAGSGHFPRALQNNGINILGGINFGVFGSNYLLWINGIGKLGPLLKYCSKFMYEYGTNSFSTASAPNNSTTLNQIIASDRAVWTSIRNNAASQTGLNTLRIVGSLLLCHTTGTYAGNTGQTVLGPQWDVGGDVDSYNVSRISDVGVAGRLDGYIDYSTIVRYDPSSKANADYYKWVANGVTDGLHPTGALHASMAVALRAKMDATT